MGEAERPTCGTCSYYEGPPSKTTCGICHRHAPRPRWCHEIPGDAVTYQNCWPEVDFDDWCGEHPDFPAYLRKIRGGTVNMGWGSIDE